MKIVKGGPLPERRRRGSAQDREAVRAACEEVRRFGDRALRRRVKALAVPGAELRRAFSRLTPQARSALELACRHVGLLARRELAALKEFNVKPTAGVSLYQRLLPVRSVGILAPSRQIVAVLMGAIPAAVAGVERRVLCAASADGELDPHVLAAAYMCDITEVYRVGGVLAAAALAYGTKTILAVDLIVGAGDSAVAIAKQELASVCGVDLATGPHELLVLADSTAPPEFVAADLLAQAELDPEAVCLLVTTSADVAQRTRDELRRLGGSLPKGHPARGPLSRARAVVVESLDEAVGLVNARAPQRLALLVKRPDDLAGRLRSYGSLLVGPQSPAALGELVTGANALLPAAGAAGQWGAFGVGSLLRRVTVQQVDPSAYHRLSRAAATLAELQGRTLTTHALTARLTSVEDD
ncbi:MAG: histidinol dehydrogenase [bacterium]